MKLSFLLCLVLISHSLEADNCGSNNTEYVEQEEVVYPVWVGPGLYGGIWFDNESDYQNWQRNQNNRNRDQNRRQDRRGARQGNRQERRGGGGGGR